MASIKIIKPGLLTTVQDRGRLGYQQFGVPVCGAMDSFSHRVSNILVGNEVFDAVLETTLLGPEIEILDDSVIAVTGGDLSPTINKKSIPMWKSIYVNKGDVLSFGAAKSGCRSYVSFAGGIDVPLVMGSKSTYLKGNIGGYKGRKLESGDILKILNSKENLKNLKNRMIIERYKPHYSDSIELRVILGPQKDRFTNSGIETLLSNEYTVTSENDRMGYRLDGKKVQTINGSDIISDGIAFGAIQITNSGFPIIMMTDRQTVGGYAKIACVISSDLPKIAQAKSRDKVRFKEVSIEEAQNIIVKENIY